MAMLKDVKMLGKAVGSLIRDRHVDYPYLICFLLITARMPADIYIIYTAVKLGGFLQTDLLHSCILSLWLRLFNVFYPKLGPSLGFD